MNIKQIAVVHGEEDQSMAFADLLKKNQYSVHVPKRLESIVI